jgi:predicted DNA binding protein
MISKTGTVTSTLACLCLLLNTACTTTRGIETADAKVGETAIVQGDKVTVTLLDGDRYELEVVENQEDYFVGTDQNGFGETIYWNNVHSIAVTRVDVGKTILISPVVVAGAVIAIVVIAFASVLSMGAQ